MQDVQQVIDAIEQSETLLEALKKLGLSKTYYCALASFSERFDIHPKTPEGHHVPHHLTN